VGLVDAAVVVVADLGSHLDGPDAALEHLDQHLRDVGDLALGVEDDAAAVAEVGVGAVDEEQVGEVGDGDAQVGVGVVVAPDLAQRLSGATADVHGRQHAAALEAGGQDEHVEVDAGPVGEDNALLVDGGDLLGDEVDVVAAQGSEPAVVDEHPLAVGRVGRQHLVQEPVLVTGDLLLQVLDEEAAVPVVDGVDGPVGVFPLGVAAQGGVEFVLVDPHEPEPVPGGVPGNLFHEQPGLRGELAVVVVVGDGPLR